MAIQLPSRVSIPPDVLSRELEGEIVLLNANRESYYSLDRVGAQIWRAFEKDGTVNTVIEGLLEEYDVDESTLRRDVLDLISELQEFGLIEIDRG